MRFEALEVSIDIIRSLRQPLEILRSRDADLHRQVRRAASSVALNISEGNRRAGKDRLHHFRIAAGSAAEVCTALRVAAAWGDLQEPLIAGSLQQLDRLLAMLWGSGDSVAERVTVRFGKASVNQIVVLEGLEPGDTVALADTTQWSGKDRIVID